MRYLGKTPSRRLLGSAIFGWPVLMSIVWALFVPRGLPVDTFILLTLTGPLVLISGGTAGLTPRLLRHP